MKVGRIAVGSEIKGILRIGFIIEAFMGKMEMK